MGEQEYQWAFLKELPAISSLNLQISRFVTPAFLGQWPAPIHSFHKYHGVPLCAKHHADTEDP